MRNSFSVDVSATIVILEGSHGMPFRGIDTVLGSSRQQLAVGSIFDYGAILDDDYFVGEPPCGPFVRRDYSRSTGLA